MAKECRQRKPCPGGSGRGVTAAAYDEQGRRAVGGEPLGAQPEDVRLELPPLADAEHGEIVRRRFADHGVDRRARRDHAHRRHALRELDGGGHLTWADDAVIVDPKVVACFTETHVAQMIGYLNNTGLDLAILINFKNAKLEWKRVLRRQPGDECMQPHLHV